MTSKKYTAVIPKMKRCKICGDKFTPYRTTQPTCKGECEYKYGMMKLKQQKQRAIKEGKENTRQQKAKVYSNEYKTDLQNEINRLARMIDERFNYACVDCGKVIRYRGNDSQRMDANGSHLHNVSGNENIRYNLHNIHTSKIKCNKWEGGRKEDYKLGLICRYGTEYLNYVESLGVTYPYLGLKEIEVVEKLSIVRKLIRTFDTFVFNDGRQAREQLNTLIGIYTKSTD